MAGTAALYLTEFTFITFYILIKKRVFASHILATVLLQCFQVLRTGAFVF